MLDGFQSPVNTDVKDVDWIFLMEAVEVGRIQVVVSALSKEWNPSYLDPLARMYINSSSYFPAKNKSAK